MLKDDCVFCKIIRHEIPAKVIKDNEHVLVIEDRSPKAPIHYLIIPKIHVENMCHLEDSHKDVVWEIMKMGRDLCNDVTKGRGFNFVSNNGAAAGQSVLHMHWHFLSGTSLGEIAKKGL